MNAFCDPVFWLFLGYAGLFVLVRFLNTCERMKEQRKWLP